MFGNFAGRGQLLSGIYYSLFSREFRREQRAFLQGRKAFADNRYLGTTSSSFLRRNIHRIEKGLICRPRREVFAIDYIAETVAVYEKRVRDGGNMGNGENLWAHDVLCRYFEVVGPHPILDVARRKFEGIRHLKGEEPPDRHDARVPYERNTPSSPVTYQDLLGLAKQRRSVRWFQAKSVPREVIAKALAIATLSPSACNRQPFTFRVFDKEPYLSIAAGLPPGTRGYEHQFRCVIAVVGQQRYYSEERDRHLIYIDGSLATMSLILAFETLGLSSCCINWPDIEERELAAEKALQLEPDERIVMFIAVGYADPDGLIPYSEKRTPEEICRFNFE